MSIAAVPAVRPIIRVNEVGEFVRNRSCERRFKLEFNGRAEARLLPFFERLFNPLDPVLQDMGEAREDEWEQLLVAAGVPSVDMTPTGPDGEATWADFSLLSVNCSQGNAASVGKSLSPRMWKHFTFKDEWTSWYWAGKVSNRCCASSNAKRADVTELITASKLRFTE